MSSQLNASSSKKAISLYFKLPKNTYEKFVNKKWCERKNYFETKKTFIERTLLEWKATSEGDRITFLSEPAPQNNRISMKTFFSPVPKNIKSSSHQPSCEKEPETSTRNKPLNLNVNLTDNAHSALKDRDGFLASNELVLTKEFLKEIGYERSYDDCTFKDPNFLRTISKISYDWKKFSDLRKKYEAGAVFIKKGSKIKDDLEQVREKTKSILDILNQVIDIKVEDSMNSFALSKTYLKKAEITAELLTACANLNSIINDRHLHYALSRRISQQKENSSSFATIFTRRENELLNFVCENNTKLPWTEVFDTLIEMENSNNNKFPIEITKLIRAANIISTNIVTRRDELQINNGTETIVKLFPVIYVCNKDIDCFINIHEFVFTPGIFEALFILPQEELQSEEGANLFQILSGRMIPRSKKQRMANLH